MEITLKQIKELRARTGAGVTMVKEALEKSNGDVEKAIIYLREKGIASAEKRAEKIASNGFIAHYIHGEGTAGVLLELNSETDFASRSPQFRELAREIAIQIAATTPEYVSIDDIPEDVMAKERALAEKGLDEKKPKEIREKIVEGKLSKFFEEKVLLEQRYVKDESKKIKDMLNEALAAIGEKIEIGRFCLIKIADSRTSCKL